MHRFGLYTECMVEIVPAIDHIDFKKSSKVRLVGYVTKLTHGRKKGILLRCHARSDRFEIRRDIQRL